jgi:hypothetical protein
MECPLVFTSDRRIILTGLENAAFAGVKLGFITAANYGHEKWRAKAIFANILLARA